MSRTKFDRMNLAISFLATLGILGIIFSIIAIDSFAQSELTAVSAQDLESNAISSLSLGDPFFVEQGKIIGQRGTYCYTATPDRI